jgi:(1->4)-alpha-D-glucan 1-alpha-D-glucosylmutase
VDRALRRRLLAALHAEIDATEDLAAFARELFKTWEDGRVKLYVTRQALRLRRDRAGLFCRGEYRPLETDGPLAEHVCAFARVGEGDAAVTAVPRLCARRGVDIPPLGPEYWGGTVLRVPADLGSRFLNTMTGEHLQTTGTPGGPVLALGEVFRSFPVALLAREA